MPIERRNWQAALSRQEQRDLRTLERQIRAQEKEARDGGIREQRVLVYLKFKRQQIQNRVTVRARRGEQAVVAGVGS
jgi:hypothetical protein